MKQNITEQSISDFSFFGDTSKFKEMADMSNTSVVECIESYIKHKQKNNKILIAYRPLINYIKAIDEANGITLKPIVVCDMFWNQFHNYLLSVGLSPNTINNMCGRLHAVLVWASKYGAKVSPTVDECYLTKGRGPSKKPKIALTQDEVSRITYFDIDGLKRRSSYKETLKKVRDQFVISCFIGQRYSDVKRIQPDCFAGEVFSITQQKTGNKAVVDLKKIAAYPEVVRKLLEKYNYNAPYPHDINDYNKYLHELFQAAGFDDEIKHEYKINGKIVSKTYKKYELISSHTARRTMITNAVMRGLHNEEVRRASGHKSESAFSGYICYND